MKNILFQKVPMNENGDFSLSWEQISNIHSMVKRAVPEDYIVITSPMDLSKIEGDTKIIKIDCKKYSANELLEIIEKANMYDGLCK